MSARDKAAEIARARLLHDQAHLHRQHQLSALRDTVTRFERAARTTLIAQLSLLAERDERFRPILARLRR